MFYVLFLKILKDLAKVVISNISKINISSHFLLAHIYVSIFKDLASSYDDYLSKYSKTEKIETHCLKSISKLSKVIRTKYLYISFQAIYCLKLLQLNSVIQIDWKSI